MRRCLLLPLVLAACSDPSGGSTADAAAPDAATDAATPDAATDAATDAAVDARPDAAPPGPNAGFPTPTATTRANTREVNAWADVGPADWSCLGTATSDQPSTGSIALSGYLRDFQNTSGVGAAQITAHAPTTPQTALGTATSDNVTATRGRYAMTLGPLPAGQTRYTFRSTASGYLTTSFVNRYLPPGGAPTLELSAISEATATALPAFIGLSRDPTKTLVIGTLADCQGRAVSNAVVGVSTTPAAITHLPGTNTFYFSAGSSSLPVRHNVAPVMNKDGRFVVLDADPTLAASAYVQAWGFRNVNELAAGTMTLLAELPVGLEANAAVDGVLEARRN